MTRNGKAYFLSNKVLMKMLFAPEYSISANFNKAALKMYRKRDGQLTETLQIGRAI